LNNNCSASDIYTRLRSSNLASLCFKVKENKETNKAKEYKLISIKYRYSKQIKAKGESKETNTVNGSKDYDI
jgi:hypothetical protein